MSKRSRNRRSSGRRTVQTKDNRRIDVSGVPYTGAYRSVPHIWFQRPRDLPPFSFATIRGMLLDPEVRLCFATRAAPICGAEFGYEVETQPGMPRQWKQGIECKHPEIGNYVYRMLERIWRQHLPAILRSQVWGWSAGEITLKLSEAGLVEIDKMEPRHASDCRLLKVNHKRWGVAITRIEGVGTVNLPFPYAWFHCHNAEDGDDYGVSAALGAYSPWADKWFQGGALDVRRLFMHKDAYAGMDIGYPDGEVWVPGQDTPVPAVDIARQIAEESISGGVIVRPSERDENGNEKWPIQRAQVSSNPQHILQFPKDLDEEIRHGFEIPDGVSDNASSGEYAGKRVTVAGFYAGLDSWVVQILCDLKEQVLDPLVSLNFGFVPEYEIKHKPLAKQAMEQQGQTEQDSAGAGQGQQPGQSAGVQTGFNPAGYLSAPQQPPQPAMMGLGRGEYSIDEVLEASRRVARMAVQHSIEVKHDYSSTQFDLPDDIAREVIEIASHIPDELLASDGRELSPHVTVKYGLHADTAEALQSVVAGFGSVDVQLGGISCFCGDEHDVLKIDVESERLHALNAKIAASLEATDTHPTYIPHVTIAYVTKGSGEKLAWMLDDRLKGRDITFDTLLFSDKQRIKTPIALSNNIARMAAKKTENDLGEGRWITIGAEPVASGEDGGEDGKVGGRPVFIGSDGLIKTGPFAGATLDQAFGDGGLADQKQEQEQGRQEPEATPEPQQPVEPEPQPAPEPQAEIPDDLPGIIKTLEGFTKKSDRKTLQTTGATNQTLGNKVRDHLLTRFPHTRVYTHKNRMAIQVVQPGITPNPTPEDEQFLKDTLDKFGLVDIHDSPLAVKDILNGKFQGHTLTKGKWQGSPVSLDGAPPVAAKQAATGMQKALSPFQHVKLDEIGWWNGKAMKMLGVYVRAADGQIHRIHFQKKAMKDLKPEAIRQRVERYKSQLETRIANDQKILDSYMAAGKTNPQITESLSDRMNDLKLIKRWTFAEENPDRYIEAIAAHEASHAVYYQSKAGGGISAAEFFKQELQKEFPNSREQKQAAAQLGEYAYKDGPVEYWAEIGCAVALGLQDQVPPKLLAAYQRTVDGIKQYQQVIQQYQGA